MRGTIIIVAALLLVACGTTVTNRMYFERDFMDSNPGREASALADPIEEPPGDPNFIPPEPGEPGEEMAGPQETGGFASPISGQTGTGYQILVFSQSGTAAQDVAAQVDAALKARLAANSPNADLGGNETPDPPDDE